MTRERLDRIFNSHPSTPSTSSPLSCTISINRSCSRSSTHKKTRSAGSMAERLTTNQEVPGSTPGWIVTSKSTQWRCCNNCVFCSFTFPLFVMLAFHHKPGGSRFDPLLDSSTLLLLRGAWFYSLISNTVLYLFLSFSSLSTAGSSSNLPPPNYQDD